jgi:hypothetical protein
MRPVVLEAWKLAVTETAAQQLPGFHLYTRKEMGEPRNLIRYVWSPRPDLHCFIVFRPIESEAFDAWIGWSTDGRCPFARTQDPESFKDLNASTAICPTAWIIPRHGKAHWSFWNSPDALLDDPTAFGMAYGAHYGKTLTPAEAQVEVGPAVAEGFREIVEHGIPYLQRRAVYYKNSVE